MVPDIVSPVIARRRLPRPPLLLILGAVGCAPALVPGPGHLLLGTWSGAAASLTGTSSTATLVLPCVTVRFQPLRLGDSSRFEVVGTIAHVTDPVPQHRGDPFPLSGQVVGDQVVISYSSILKDTRPDTLALGRRDVSLCHP
jgi:hypothetical protein